LRLAEDERGLAVAADLAMDDPDVQRLAAKTTRGLVTHMSFAFIVKDQSWNEDRDYRWINEVDLHRGDVSVVTQPANPATSFVVGDALAPPDRPRSAPSNLGLYRAKARALALASGVR
jgi:HK97 family phage prohead protease